MKSIWVLNYRTSDLQSVENISSSLIDLYRALPGYTIKLIELSDFSSHRTELEEFKKTPPVSIAVVHPSVNYHLFFQSLLTLQPDITLLFHVFGNFVRNGDLWTRQGHLLRGRRIKFLAASPSYEKVLSAFIAKENLGLLPFPVQMPSELKREAKPLLEDTWKMIYAGRYHEQKNCTAMIEVLDTLAVSTQQKIQLTLMVAFDDFNPTTIQTEKRQGEQYARFLRACGKTSGYLSVHFVPHNSFEEMIRQFSLHHAFISLSTFFDEDYGCAVAEALSAGLPCVLSRWGGYGDFINAFPGYCLGLDVTNENHQLILDIHSLESAVEKACTLNQSEREELSRKVKAFVSKEKLSSELKREMDNAQVFHGFSHTLSALAKELKTSANVDNFKKYYEPFWNFQEKNHAD